MSDSELCVTNATRYHFHQSEAWHEKLFADVVLLCSLLGFKARARRLTHWGMRSKMLGVRITGDNIREIPCLLGRKRAMRRLFLDQTQFCPEVRTLSESCRVHHLALDGDNTFVRADRIVLGGFVPPTPEHLQQAALRLADRILNLRLGRAAAESDLDLDTSIRLLHRQASVLGVVGTMKDAANNRRPVSERWSEVLQQIGDSIRCALDERDRDRTVALLAKLRRLRTRLIAINVENGVPRSPERIEAADVYAKMRELVTSLLAQAGRSPGGPEADARQTEEKCGRLIPEAEDVDMEGSDPTPQITEKDTLAQPQPGSAETTVLPTETRATTSGINTANTSNGDAGRNRQLADQIRQLESTALELARLKRHWYTW